MIVQGCLELLMFCKYTEESDRSQQSKFKGNRSLLIRAS